MDVAGPIVSPFLQAALERLISSIAKPTNVKARLSAVKAYCVFYPIRKLLICLKEKDQSSLKRLVLSIKSDPALVNIACSLIGASYEFHKREDFRRNSGLLYVPEPLLEDLRRDVKSSLEAIIESIQQDNYNRALKEIHDEFREAFEKGDVQVPDGEALVDVALCVLLALAKMEKDPTENIVRNTITYMYPALIAERSMEMSFPSLVGTLSLVVPLGTPPFTLEYLQKLRQAFPSGDKLRANPFVVLFLQQGERILGFSYDEFKKAFNEAETILKSSA